MSHDEEPVPQLFLIRHAQSANNAQHESRRVSDPGLTSLGRKQAGCLARFFEQVAIESLICSAFRRALQTADSIRTVSGHTPEVIVDLHEHGGCYEGWNANNFRGASGMSPQQIAKEFGKVTLPESFPEKGWWASRHREEHSESDRRATQVEQVLKCRVGQSQGNVVCVSHADFLSKLLLVMFGEKVRQQEQFHDLKNVGITRVTISKSDWVLHDLNRVDFLPEELISS